MGFSTEIKKKINMESQNSQSNLKEENQNWRHDTSLFQTLLQVCRIKIVWP